MFRKICKCLRNSPIKNEIEEVIKRKEEEFNSLPQLPPSITSIMQEELKEITIKQTKKYIPKIFIGKVVNVYDGDTITIATKLENDKEVYRFIVRLRGIDCAEMRGSENEKRVAIKARDELSRQVMNKFIFLRNVEYEKYGRILADVYLENMNINQWMLDNKLAIKYDGKKKIKPINWEDI